MSPLARQLAPLVGLLASLALIVACGDDGGPVAETVDGAGGKTDQGGGEFDAKLATANDPIGRWLRERSGVDANGELFADYQSVMAGLAEQQGCGIGSVGMYVISDSLISGEKAFPRLVTTVCTSDDARADELFMSAPSPNAEGTDIEVHDIEMFAWDADARRYRFYKTLPIEGEPGKIQVTIEPALCQDCHLTPNNLDGRHMPMLPIMNEITSPWPHWSAEPDFRSHSFQIDEEIQQAPAYAALADGGWKTSVSRLEQIIRNGHNRVAAARVRDRRDKPADLTRSMAMLRPVFCDEQLSYATEDDVSGLIQSSLWVDDGVRNMLKKIQPAGLPWNWLNEGKVRLDSPSSSADLLALVPIRGSADVSYEDQLASVSRGLSPWQILQVRTLDWQRPVFSDFRCGLWTSALSRVLEKPPEVTAETPNYTLMQTLYAEIMSVEIEGRRVPIVSSAPEQEVIVVPLMDDRSFEALSAALASGSIAGSTCTDDDLGVCQLTVQELGDMIERHVTANARLDARPLLQEERHRRACHVMGHFGNAPDLGDTAPCTDAP